MAKKRTEKKRTEKKRTEKKRTANPVRLSDQIRRSIEASGVSRYRIAQETGISQSTLSRFISGERGLTTTALDTLAAFLRLNITTRPTEFSAAEDRGKA
jgi:transcriptional regulator with XRE-family HTH domain